MCRRVAIVYGRGCPRTKLDLARLRTYFEANSWLVTDRIGEAEVIVVSGCSFLSDEENLSLRNLRTIARKKRADALMVVSGCLVGTDGGRLAAEFGALPVAVSDGRQLDAVICAAVPLSSIPDQNYIDPSWVERGRCLSCWERFLMRARVPGAWPLNPARLVGLKPSPPREPFRIRIVRGCASECTYCTIRMTWGEVKSKPLDEVSSELERAIAESSPLIHLTGEDVGAYGRDIGLTVVDLLRALLERPGSFQFCWSDFGPRWLVEHCSDLLQLFELHSHRIAYAGFPVQSGSDKVLGLMNRGYTAPDAERCLLALRKAAPEVPLNTHVLLGFPGETRSDYLQTLRLIRSIGFANVGIYAYSPRPGTTAMRLPNQLPASTRTGRRWAFHTRLGLGL